MINQNCPYVLRDLYYYDIVSAFPTLMQMQGYNFKDVDLNDKSERNIYIGKEQLRHKNLSSFLNDSIKDLTDFYLSHNEIEDDDVIYRQKDGFIIKKPLVKNDLYIEMKLRYVIDLMFIDINKQSMITFDSCGVMVVKGVRHKYDKLDDIYQKFLNLDFYNRRTLMLQLKNIKDSVVNSTDKSLFGINAEDGSNIFILKNNKSIRTFDMDFVDIEEIDKTKYFNEFFKPFIDGILMEIFYETSS